MKPGIREWTRDKAGIAKDQKAWVCPCARVSWYDTWLLQRYAGCNSIRFGRVALKPTMEDMHKAWWQY